jgi:hypothetical protein
MKEKIQTDNSCLEEKILLRLNSIETIPEKDFINVLECFRGDGVIWSEVAARTPRKIRTLRIDLKNDKKGVYLQGNNLKYLGSMPLNGFDIIDLDAYGSPFNQLQIVFKRGYRGVVHCTFIQSGMGGVNHELLEFIGYSKKMVSKCPTLFSKNAFQKMCDYLQLHGIKTLQAVNIDRKHYFWFRKT